MLPRLIFAPSARKTSENSAELVPKDAPSDSPGSIPVFAVKVVTTTSEGVVPPMMVLSIVLPSIVEFVTSPPEIVRSSAT